MQLMARRHRRQFLKLFRLGQGWNLQKPPWRQEASLVAWNITKNTQLMIPLAGTLNTLRQTSFIAIQNDGLDYFVQSDGK